MGECYPKTSKSVPLLKQSSQAILFFYSYIRLDGVLAQGITLAQLFVRFMSKTDFALSSRSPLNSSQLLLWTLHEESPRVKPSRDG